MIKLFILLIVPFLSLSIDKQFVTRSGFLLLRGRGEGGLSESVKKGKFVTKIFFADVV